MPRQNTRPENFPPFILRQIEQLAQHIIHTRKQRGETQAQWAEKLGISQPTMARIERGDPAIATATYVMCLWMVNPELNLVNLVAPKVLPIPVQATTSASPNPQDSVAEEFADLLAQWTSAASATI